MKGKPSVDEFISGAQADKAERPVNPKATVKELELTVTGPVVRVQRSFRLPVALCDALRDKAYELTKEHGVRVTEQELVEQMFSLFLK